jgi:HEAT repeat protein
LNLKASPESVVPVLLKLLEDGSADVRKSATNALLAIDPETAAKAGVK